MRILIAGSRCIENEALIYRHLDEITEKLDKESITVVTGGARGVDRIAKNWADDRGIKNIEMNAEWDLYGKSAGYKRNTKMHEWLTEDEDRLCICFWDGRSRGTAHNFELARKYETKLLVFKERR